MKKCLTCCKWFEPEKDYYYMCRECYHYFNGGQPQQFDRMTDRQLRYINGLRKKVSAEAWRAITLPGDDWEDCIDYIDKKSAGIIIDYLLGQLNSQP